MINMFEVNETNKMITQENLDVRTITLGNQPVGLRGCRSGDSQPEYLRENNRNGKGSGLHRG